MLLKKNIWAVRKLSVPLNGVITHQIIMAHSKKVELDRIDFRIPKWKKKLIQLAAEYEGMSVTDYIISIATRESRDVIAERESILKSDADREIFFDALMNPPKVSDKLKKAVANYEKKKLE